MSMVPGKSCPAVNDEYRVPGVCPSGGVFGGVIVEDPEVHAKDCALDPVGKGEPAEISKEVCIIRSWF